MRVTDQTLLEQMNIHELEVLQRKVLLNFSQQDVELLMQCRNFILTNIEEIVREFYERQTSFEDIALIIGDADTLKRLMSVLKNYILSLFKGQYDLEYVNNRLRIGLVHKRIGVEPKYYLSAVKNLKDLLNTVISQHIQDKNTRNASLNALDKILNFDTQLVVDTYIRSLFSAIRAAKEKTDNYNIILEKQVEERTRELRELSRTDGLTGLYNHRAFLEFLQRDLFYAKRNALPLSLIYFDVDHFKSINDSSGHQKGDAILKALGKILRDISREIDTPCRYGGDEFCVILSGSTAENARAYCERLLGAFSKQHQDVTLSIGIAETGPKTFSEPDELIRHADSAMYDAKKIAGFQVVVQPRTIETDSE